MLTIPNLIYLQDDMANASTTTFDNQWSYNWIPLAAAYGACATLNMLAIGIGIAAVVDNGGVGISRSGFLRVVMTTRNRTLDVLVGDRGRGEDDMQKEIEQTVVKFGELIRNVDVNGTRKVGFGFPSEVVELSRKHK
jgi:hypothetical protein